MTFKKIVGFGDSWMWGDELLDPALDSHPSDHRNTEYRESNCFLGHLGKHYNVPTENFGIPGGSLQSTIWTYLWWIEHEVLPLDQCVVLIALTEPARQSFYNPLHISYPNDRPWNKFVHSSWIHNNGLPNISGEWKNMVKLNTVLTSCKELHELTYKQSTYFFQGQRNNHYALFQFNTLDLYRSSLPSVLWSKFSLAQLLSAEPNQKELFAKNRHPNELGHQKIAEMLITEIDRAILA